jgi:ribA/ribD-fused uncharacterized protein
MQSSTINHFSGENKEFSNFYPVEVLYQNIKFPSVEHGFVAAKSNNKLFWKEISEMPANSAGLVKRKGRKINLRPDWDLIKLKVMRELLEQKFRQPKFKEKLLSTGDVQITEGNYWHDNYWGDCYCKKCKNIKGHNHLGRLLMKIREELKNENNGNGRHSQRVWEIKRSN